MKKSHILSVIKKLISKKVMACLFLSVGVGHAKAQQYRLRPEFVQPVTVPYFHYTFDCC